MTAKDDAWIEVKIAEGTLERYTVRWSGGNPEDDGYLDKQMMTTIDHTVIGCKVGITWSATSANGFCKLALLEPHVMFIQEK